MKNCPFCQEQRVLLENDLAYAIFDKYPVSTGHILVIPRRHHETIFESKEDEITAIFSLLRRVRDYLASKYDPDGYNIGINIGRAAGQSIKHLHMHVIPRYRGDRRIAKGGVRGVIPDKQSY
ncbi:MAG TPA: HIT family protein [Candidatus Krumholzibacteriaceae bacterium]|nr:HIT family protein [Candidatus Krumholzibacteriaceae bacterium]